MVKIVAHPETNEVVTVGKNPAFGTIRMDSRHDSFENGFVNIQKRTAFVRGPIEVLQGLGLRDGQVMPGKIVRRESFEPFYEGQSPKINPSTGEVVLTNGKETYLEFLYTEDRNAHDTWVGESSEVSEEVQEALTEQAV